MIEDGPLCCDLADLVRATPAWELQAKNTVLMWLDHCICPLGQLVFVHETPKQFRRVQNVIRA